MIIIGEKINGFVPKTLEAIKAHDDEYIKYIAKAQADAGATYIDVCAGVEPEIEHETMKWLMDLVQSVTDTPLCIDSPDPQVVVDMMPYANEVGCLNSISMEGNKCDVILPAIAGTEWKVVALTCDDDGIPDDPKVKYEIAKRIMAKVDEYGVDHDNILFANVRIGERKESTMYILSIDRETEGRWHLDLMGEGKLTGGWIIPLSEGSGREYVLYDDNDTFVCYARKLLILEDTQPDRGWHVYDLVVGDDSSSVTLAKVPGY